MQLLRFLLVSLLLAKAQAWDQQLTKEVAFSPAWLKLIHYDSALLGGFKRKIHDPQFYLHPQGKADPHAELLAYLENAESSACDFPARHHFLRSRFDLAPAPQCPEVEKWQKKFNANAVQLVYSAQYLSNPSSVMGHTFFRFINPEVTDYLHFTINYAAQVDEGTNGLTYAYKGLRGGFPGFFFVDPYYVKVEEYNEIDLRDMWEYDLDLNEAQVKFLLLHLYELSQKTKFSYYFIDENCAYFLLAALEAVRPEWKLIEVMPFFFIPSQIVRPLEQVGAIKKIHYKPSLRNRLDHQLSEMEGSHRTKLRQLISGKIPAENIADKKVLEAALDQLDLVRSGREGYLNDEDTLLYNQILLARSRLGPQVTQTLPVPTAPHLGHMPFRFSLAAGSLGDFNQRFLELSFRPAIHELMEMDTGYSRFSEIDLLHSRLRYYPGQKKLSIDSLKILSISNLPHFNLWEKKFSWKVFSEFLPNKAQADLSTYALAQGIHYGVGARLGKKWPYLYLLPGVRAEIGNVPKHYRLEAGPLVGLMWASELKWKMHLSTMPMWDLFKQNRRLFFLPELSYTASSRWSVGSSALLWWNEQKEDSSPTWQEYKMALNYFF